MIESGTTNLIFIMSSKKMKLDYKLKALICIRKATSCKVSELLDSFVANGLIERLVDVLNFFGEETFKRIEAKKHHERNKDESAIREIQVQTLCILI